MRHLTERLGGTPLKRRIGFLLLLVAAAGVSVVIRFGARPPSDRSAVEFYWRHREPLERLRALLASDPEVLRVGSWGVMSRASPVPFMPPQGSAARARFDEYVGLLKSIDGLGASRSAQACPEVCVLLWATGWASDTAHLSVCARCDVPSNQVASVDTGMPKKSAGGEGVYRHVDGNWYLRRDWRE